MNKSLSKFNIRKQNHQEQDDHQQVASNNISGLKVASKAPAEPRASPILGVAPKLTPGHRHWNTNCHYEKDP